MKKYVGIHNIFETFNKYFRKPRRHFVCFQNGGRKCIENLENIYKTFARDKRFSSFNEKQYAL